MHFGDVRKTFYLDFKSMIGAGASPVLKDFDMSPITDLHQARDAMGKLINLIETLHRKTGTPPKMHSSKGINASCYKS